MKNINNAAIFILITVCLFLGIGIQSVKAQDGFIGEIRMFAGTFAPRNWAFCDGSLIPIAENTALFSILGTTYGGDGQTTFALPDLRGRMPISPGTGPGLTNRSLGEMGGEEAHLLTVSEIPSHSHPYSQYADSTVGSSDKPAGRIPARNAAGIPQYGSTPNATTGLVVVGNTGSSQPHNNMPPYTSIYFIICAYGIYPSRP